MFGKKPVRKPVITLSSRELFNVKFEQGGDRELQQWNAYQKATKVENPLKKSAEEHDRLWAHAR